MRYELWLKYFIHILLAAKSVVYDRLICGRLSKVAVRKTVLILSELIHIVLDEPCIRSPQVAVYSVRMNRYLSCM